MHGAPLAVLMADTKTPLLTVDTDPGVDDIIAILLAIASPELEILAYIACYGNTELEASHLNILKAYQAIDRQLELFPSDRDRFPNYSSEKKPILSCGASAPLKGEIHTAQYFHGSDGLGDITQRHPELSDDLNTGVHAYLDISEKSGVEVAIEILRSYPPRTVTYILLGPMTNLALVMRQESQLVAERIGRIVSMGGALDVPGNTSPVAEFNYFADPYAVRELLISSDLHPILPRERFIMLPLDITTPHELPFPVYKDVVDPTFVNTSKPSLASNKAPLVHFTSSFLERTREIMLQFGKDAMELHDIVAIWCAIKHPPFPDSQPMTFARGWQAHARVFDIERTGELTRGMLVVDRREDISAYPLGANRSEAQRKLHDGHIDTTTQLEKSDVIDVITGVTRDFPGVVCMHETPGPGVLLELLLKRVWGCTMRC